MNNFQRNIYRTEEDISTPFSISSTVVSAGTGTLDITGGVAGETIFLDFVVTQEVGVFNELSFTAPITVLLLEPLHLTRSGNMVLNGSGNGSSTYTFDPLVSTSSCLITVTSRSSGNPTGVGSSTNIV